MFFCCGHAMSQIQIFLSILRSKIKSDLLAVVIFRKWNSKPCTSFALLFSSTIPLSHFCWYQIASWSINSCCFAQAIARITSTLLCLVRYSLFANLVHPATRCSTVFECCLHIQHLPSFINPLASFHDLVSTICSNMVMIAAVFPWLRFWDNHTWHSCSCSLYNLLCCSFLLYSSTLCFFITFFSFSFGFFYAGFHPSISSS